MTLTHVGTQTIATERLILRRYKLSDAESMFRNYAGNAEVCRFLSWPPYGSADGVRAWLAGVLDGYRRDDCYHWAILCGGEVIGSISAMHTDELNCSCELGYCIGRAYWGRGIMTEAAGAVVDYLIEKVHMHRVTAKHDVKNPASGGVMRRLGMRCEGRLKDCYVRRDGGVSDALSYAILRDEWEIQKEIAYYNSLPCVFDGFVDFPKLADGEVELVCAEKKPAIPEKKYVPSYGFEIRASGARVGDIGLRVGYTGGLYYGGQIGYNVDEAHRGHGYAGAACRLLIPVMKAHGMTAALITNDQGNAASRRVCEKLGARLIRLAELPEWHELYGKGQRFVNIFEWRVG